MKQRIFCTAKLWTQNGISNSIMYSQSLNFFGTKYQTHSINNRVKFRGWRNSDQIASKAWPVNLACSHFQKPRKSAFFILGKITETSQNFAVLSKAQGLKFVWKKYCWQRFNFIPDLGTQNKTEISIIESCCCWGNFFEFSKSYGKGAFSVMAK